MKCSICKNELVKEGMAKLETLNEHVSGIEPCMKSKFVCSNESCVGHTKLCWNEDGDIYGWIKGVEFVNKMSGAFGSFSRKMDVEIYKKDENYTLFQRGSWKVDVVYRYKSDEDGNVLSRKRSYTVWKKEGAHYVMHHFGIKMLIFSIKQYHKERKWKKVNRAEEFKSRIMWENGEWWRKAAYWYVFCYENFIAKQTVKKV
jgi:hypothetical protein